MLTLYGSLDSGNVYKVQLLLAHLGVAHQRVEVSQVKGHPRTCAFLAINPMGKVPTVRFDDGSVLSESGAILHYLAQDSSYWPTDPWRQSEVLRWMFFEQYSHEPCLAVNRYIMHFMEAGERVNWTQHLEHNFVRGRYALQAMETHLENHSWLGSDTYTIADIALYAYTQVAEDCGFPLDEFPRIRAWLTRVTNQPGHVESMVETSATPPLALSETT